MIAWLYSPNGDDRGLVEVTLRDGRKVTKHRLGRTRRRGGGTSRLPEGDAVPDGRSPVPESIPDFEGIRSRLRAALKQLDPLERAALAACWEGDNARARARQLFAERTGRAPATYDCALSPGKANLRQSLRPPAGLPEPVPLHALWDLVGRELRRFRSA